MGGHGKPLRGLEGTLQSRVTSGAFGRLFRWLPACFQAESTREQAEVETLLAGLARLMVSSELTERIDSDEATPDSDINTPEPEDENRLIPAGYTYLGQFIDHDITFDPASSLQKQNDPDALEDFRTPRLDLDSVYGRGPEDQPYLYAKPDRVQLRVGQERGVSGQRRHDLPRLNDDGDRTALIGDKRNDENKLVGQIHALFLDFHNKVLRDLGGGRFQEAQRIVRWCNQWIVLHDFLPRVCRADVLSSILPAERRRGPRLEFYRPHSAEGFIPVEFSVAAYRFGHSMVRPSYSLNSSVTSGTGTFSTAKRKDVPFARIPIFVAEAKEPTDAMNGSGVALPESWGVDWSFFFGDIPAIPVPGRQIPQPSYRIDATLVDPLGVLPEFVGSLGVASPFVSLAYRNLLRGFRMDLPAGQAVARTMGFPPIGDPQLWHFKGEGDEAVDWPEGREFYSVNRRWVEGKAPLWFYILKEAELEEKGRRLGQVGSQIVAETLIGLTWFDHFSYLFQAPDWTPADEKLAGLDDKLDMPALIRYVDRD